MGKTRTIYINESVLENGGIISKKISKNLPEAFYSVSSRGRFPFTDNPAFPNIEEDGFIMSVLRKSYDKCKNRLLSLGEIEGDSDDITNSLSGILMKINKIERPNRDKLEKMCNNYVIDLFGIPENTVDLGFELTDSIENASSILQLDPEESRLEYDAMKNAEDFKKEVLKKRVINMLITGAAMYFSDNIKYYLEDLYELDPDLPGLYRKASIINDYLIMSDPGLSITEKDKKQSGVVEVTIGDDYSRNFIEAKGENLISLTYESVKGLMELFASHGLPEDRRVASAVLARTDYVKAEPWNMRIGPVLWDMFMKAAGNPDSKRIPYIFMEVCKLPFSRFNRLMNEVFSGSAKASRLMSKLDDDIEYSSFLEKMGKARAEKNIIEDEFIHPEEL